MTSPSWGFQRLLSASDRISGFDGESGSADAHWRHQLLVTQNPLQRSVADDDVNVAGGPPVGGIPDGERHTGYVGRSGDHLGRRVDALHQRVRSSLRHQREHLAFAGAQHGQRIVMAYPCRRAVANGKSSVTMHFGSTPR
jgi:hypothetical protein